jgi:hypothetical protein
MIDLIIRAVAIVLDLAINNVALPETVIIPPERPAITSQCPESECEHREERNHRGDDEGAHE